LGDKEFESFKEFKYFFPWNNINNVLVFGRIKKFINKIKLRKQINADELRKKFEQEKVNRIIKKNLEKEK
jgi:hypothetical protein